MRLLFPYLARWQSANWSRYHNLLGALARRGHEVLVLQAPARPDARETNYVDLGGALAPGIRLLDVPVLQPLWQPRYPLDKLAKKGLVSVATRLAVGAVARQQAVDVLLLYNVPQVVLLGATRATVVVDLADDLLAMLRHEAGPWLRPLALPPARQSLRALIAAADLVITPSSVLAQRLGPKVRVLPNGADLARTARADGTAIRARYGTPLVAFVGAFEYVVDFPLVLEVASRLPRCTFLLVGGGRDLARVRAEVRRRELTNVVLPGPVDYATALDYMAACDVALLPRRLDPVSHAAAPLKLFEYAALRRPVVATPVAETRRLAGGWAHFGATADEWVRAIERILAEPARAAAMAARGYALVADHYRWDDLAAELERQILCVRTAAGGGAAERDALTAHGPRSTGGGAL
ncbi:MAG TPA: glycosyltransferase [Chloroflexota bacterium]|nr:glycosyltransferase [Chloroflexota bacterium]